MEDIALLLEYSIAHYLISENWNVGATMHNAC